MEQDRITQPPKVLAAVEWDEYTAAERRAINAEIAKAQKGPYHGPFKTAAEVARFLKTEIERRKNDKSSR